MIVLRPVTVDDADLLLAWRNDPGTLDGSFRKHAVDPQSHAEWLKGILALPLNALYIGSLDTQPIGSVRFYWSRQYEAEISIVIAPESRGKGYGAELIRVGCQDIWAKWGVSTILARIEPGNQRSIRAFEKAGFRATQLLMYFP